MSGVTVATMMTSTSAGEMPRFGKADLCGFNGEVAGGGAGGDDVALADAGALGDPLIRGGDHGFEVFVGEELGWDVDPDGGDFGADGGAGLQRQRQVDHLNSSAAP